MAVLYFATSAYVIVYIDIFMWILFSKYVNFVPQFLVRTTILYNAIK